jgi:transposase
MARYSILPALSLDGIIALEIIQKPFTSATFQKFIEGLLGQMNPYPRRNSVIIMDNASIHKSDELRAMVENRQVVFFECIHSAANILRLRLEECGSCFYLPTLRI